MVEYRDIKGFNGYRVGDDGSIWCCRPINGKPGGTWKWRQLTPFPNGATGHLTVNLWIDGKRRIRYVHRLVLESFVGQCPDGMEACHFPDRNPGNNKLCNLRWDTHTNNLADRVVHGTNKRGESTYNAKLTEDMVRAIRVKFAQGISQRQIAEEFGVCQSIVCGIVNRKRWAHVA